MIHYYTFGFRRDWLWNFLTNREDWLNDNPLGPYQQKALKRYLKDAGLLNSKGEPTELANVLSRLIYEREEETWLVVWINLCLNADLFRWYAKSVPWNTEWSKKELIKKLSKDKNIKERTARNAINALTNTFETSPLGKWFGRKTSKGKYLKEAPREIRTCVFAYALYAVAKRFRLIEGDTEFFQKELENILGLNEEKFEINTIILSSNGLIKTDDNKIVFRRDISSLYILEACRTEV